MRGKDVCEERMYVRIRKHVRRRGNRCVRRRNGHERRGCMFVVG